MRHPVQYEELADALVKLGCDQDAAEYHGSLCGALCVLDPHDVDLVALLSAGTSDALQPGAPTHEALAQLRDQVVQALAQPQMGFTPLLPDDGEALPVRVRALVAWCDGFLLGLATGQGFTLEACSDDVREIIEDFTQFTRAALTEDDDSELEENAYTELVEYIRVGVQLVFMELHPRERTQSGTSPPTLH
jgi:uncharacterized protein